MSSLEANASFNDRRRLSRLVDFEHTDVKPQLLAIISEVLGALPQRRHRARFPVSAVLVSLKLRAAWMFRFTFCVILR
jgi:hypothetical protein